MNRKTAAAGMMILLTLFLAMLSVAASAESYDAGTMRLLRYEGTVEIFDPEGVSRFVLENVRFASGEAMQTGEDGLASIGLDDTKIVTMDASSRVEFIQENSHLRLKLSQGTLFLDVQEKLDENESLDIETATMTVGIRGTIVFVQSDPEAESGTGEKRGTRLGVLEGTTQLSFTDTSGTRRMMDIPAGRMVTIPDASGEAGGVTPEVSTLTAEDVAGFVAEQVLRDETLTNRVIEGSPEGAGILYPELGTGSVDAGVAFGFPAEGDWTWEEPVTLVAQSASKLYDGQTLRRTSDALVYGLPQGLRIQVAAGGAQTDAGESENVITNYRIYNAADEDVTAHFPNVDRVSGTLKVDPAPLTVWTGSAEKYYDGKPLTADEAELRTVPGYEVNEPRWRNTAIVTRSALGSESMIAVSGATWVHGTNPLTGETREILLYTGQKLSICLHSNDQEQGSIEFLVETLSVAKLPEEVLRLYANNPRLRAQAVKDAGWDEKELQKRIRELGKSTERTVTRSGLKVSEGAGNDLMQDSSNVRITVDSDVTDYNSRPLNGDEAHFVPIDIDPTIRVRATSSQTEPGESANTYEIDWGNANPGNYVLTEELGTLTVLPVYSTETILTAASAEKTYDGKPLEKDDIDIANLPEGYTVEAKVEGSQTDAGEGENRITEYRILDRDGENATKAFPNLKVVSGSLRVTPATLTITTGSASKLMDGTPLTCGEVTVEGLQGDDQVTVTATGKLETAGTAVNTYSIEWGDTNRDNYTIAENLGMLEMTAIDFPVTLTAPSATRAYDGTKLTAAEVQAEGLPDGYTCAAEIAGSQLRVGSSDNEITSYRILNPDGADVTAAFTDVMLVKGTLTVTVNDTPITITANSERTVYRGEAFYSFGSCSVEGLPAGVNIEAEAPCTAKDAGVYTLHPSYYMTDVEGGFDHNACFSNITLVDGALTVEPLRLKFVSSCPDRAFGEYAPMMECTAVYENGDHAGEEIPDILWSAVVGRMSFTATLYTGDQISVTITNWEGEDAGTYAIGFVSEFDTGSASNYAVSHEDGTYRVTPAVLTVVTGSAEKVYDGTPLTNAEVTVTGLVGDDAVAVAANGSIMDAGTVRNTCAVDWGSVNSGNYTLREELGTLTIKPLDIAVELNSYDAPYSGRPIVPDGIDAKYDTDTYAECLSTDFTGEEGSPTGVKAVFSLTGGGKMQVECGSFTEAGGHTYEPRITFIPEETAANYKIIGITGKNVTIAKVNLTFDLGGGEFEYNGGFHGPALGVFCSTEGWEEGWNAEQTGDTTWKVSHSELGAVINVTVTGGGKDVGEHALSCSWSFASDSESNFTISQLHQTVKINPAALTIATESAVKTFDGTPLTAGTPTVTGLVGEDAGKVVVTASGTITNAGSVPNAYTVNWNGVNSANYSLTESVGTLTVNKAKIKVTTHNETKTYDGFPLPETTDQPFISADFLEDDIYATYVPNRIQDAGSAAATYDMHWGEASQDNYEVSEELGTLTVEKREVTVSTSGAEKTYDGTALQNESATILGLVEGETAAVKGTGTITDVGSVTNTCTIEWGSAKSGNYTVTEALGTLTVHRRPLTVTSGSADKVWDGEPLTCGDYTVDGLVGEETVSVTVTGSRTEVGTSSNTFTVTFGSAKEGNYSLTTVFGTLTVNEVPWVTGDGI